jgi:hypothetical protein
MKKRLVYAIPVIALILFVGLQMESVFAGVCGQEEQVRLGPVPVDSSAEGVRFNYVNTSQKMANVTAMFYANNNDLLSTQTDTIEPGKGLSFSIDELNGSTSIFVIANVGFEDPIVAFEDPIVAFEVPVFLKGFEVPVFLTSIETFDDSGRTGIWGTDGTSIWGSNGTSIVTSGKPGAGKSAEMMNRTAIVFPPITVAPGENVQLAVTNASQNSDGNVYLQFVDIESGETVGDDENTFCTFEIIPGTKEFEWVCGPKAVPTGETLEIRFYNPEEALEPMTVLPIVKDFEVPVFSESFEVPVFLKGFEVPVFMPTMTLRSSDTEQVKIFSGAAGLLTPSSCK